MLKGIDVNQRIEFVSQYDTDEIKTIFVFKPITTEAMLELGGQTNNGELKLVGSKVFSFLEMTIAEIKNFDGTSVSEILRILPPTVVAELVNEAGKINKLTGEDAKNS